MVPYLAVKFVFLVIFTKNEYININLLILHYPSSSTPNYNPYPLTMDFDTIRAALRKENTRICGVPTLVALNLVFFLDQWFKSVSATAIRFVSAVVKTNSDGTDNIIAAGDRVMREGYVSFTAGVVKDLGDRLMTITLEDILASDKLLSAFLFSITKNVKPLKIFAAWFNSLSDEDKAKLTVSTNAVKAALAHVAWLHATCEHFLSDAVFDPVVQLCSVEYHGDIPSFDELLSGEPSAYLKNYIRLYESSDKLAFVSDKMADKIDADEAIKMADDVKALLAVDLNKFATFTDFLLANPEVSF